jgi:hypothetical protein
MQLKKGASGSMAKPIKIKPYGFYLFTDPKSGMTQRVAVKRVEDGKVIYCNRLSQAIDKEMLARCFCKRRQARDRELHPGIHDGVKHASRPKGDGATNDTSAFQALAADTRRGARPSKEPSAKGS